jgi:hypothetical protein
MTISIWGRYRSLEPEVIDRASTRNEAERLLGEYTLAFGAYPGQHAYKDWNLWVGRKNEEPKRGEEHGRVYGRAGYRAG